MGNPPDWEEIAQPLLVELYDSPNFRLDFNPNTTGEYVESNLIVTAVKAFTSEQIELTKSITPGQDGQTILNFRNNDEEVYISVAKWALNGSRTASDADPMNQAELTINAGADFIYVSVRWNGQPAPQIPQTLPEAYYSGPSTLLSTNEGAAYKITLNGSDKVFAVVPGSITNNRCSLIAVTPQIESDYQEYGFSQLDPSDMVSYTDENNFEVNIPMGDNTVYNFIIVGGEITAPRIASWQEYEL